MAVMAESLLTDAAAGRLAKSVLAGLLPPEPRAKFLAACAVIERRFTDACAANNDPCLASGCALEGEACLEPLLQAESEYQKACGAEWVRLIAEAGNRAEGWSDPRARS